MRRSQSELDLTAELAIYVGSEEHKAKRWRGGLRAVRKRRRGRVRRPKKQRTTVCHLVSEEDRERATRWIREAVRKGQCGFVHGDGRFPKHVWHADDDGGHRCARWARRALNAGPGERFRSVIALAPRLDAPRFSSAAPVSGLRALGELNQDDVRIHLGGSLRARRRPESALFALGRAVGDAIANPPVARSVVNGLHDASRQAAGRAFAAEFLAPVEETLSMREHGKDAASIAAEFGVSEELVERQLRNRHCIVEACAA